MSTFCPHCREEVSADELLDGDSAWTCYNCQHGNMDEQDECEHCGLSRDASDYLTENG